MCWTLSVLLRKVVVFISVKQSYTKLYSQEVHQHFNGVDAGLSSTKFPHIRPRTFTIWWKNVNKKSIQTRLPILSTLFDSSMFIRSVDWSKLLATISCSLYILCVVISVFIMWLSKMFWKWYTSWSVRYLLTATIDLKSCQIIRAENNVATIELRRKIV